MTVVPLRDHPLIFDRRENRHPWEPALEALDGDGFASRRVVAANWRMDHRVSQRRSKALLDYPELTSPPGPDEWLQGINGFHRDHLCQPATPGPGLTQAACWEAANERCFLSRGTLAPHEQLVHVASFNRLLGRIDSAATAAGAMAQLALTAIVGKAPPRRALPAAGGASFDVLVDAYADRLSGLGEVAVQQVAAALCQGMGPQEPPWWAAFASEVVPLLDARDGTGLCRALGLGHLNAGEWLMVWRYEVGELESAVGGALAAPLLRPTVVEAGGNPWHFPSPPGRLFGVTMPLVTSRGRAFREVLHPPLRGQLAESAATGVLLKVAEQPAEHGSLTLFRQHHRVRLENEDRNGDTKAWLERHAERP